MMVIAGAGSGKTRVLTYRIAFILDQGLADPQEILALTFTNKAAKEMKNRIFQLIGPEGKSVMMGTFHSIFSRILRVEASRIGFTNNFTIYDSEDSQRLIKTLVKEKGLDDKIFKPRVIAGSISKLKNKLVNPKKALEDAYDDFDKTTAEIYQQYEQRLLKANSMDFDDLLVKSIKLFMTHSDVLYKYQHRFRYILVDEYQDTNHAQYLLTRMLAAVHENICVVGDDAQSIYAFRGANIENILSFQKDYNDTQLYKLEQNYRSTQFIVDAANSVIKRNKYQIEKKVFTKNEPGEKIPIVATGSEQDEARRVSGTIREQKQLYNYFNKDFAVLYRTNSQSRAIEDEMRRSGIKYRVFGGLSFYQRKEIKDVVAYMRMAVNPADGQALLRIINYPTRGIGKTSLERITVFAYENNLNIWEALNQIGRSGLSARVVNKVKDFVSMIKSFGVHAKKYDAFQTATHIAKQSGILKELHSENTIEGLGRWENVQELLNASQAFVDDPDQEEKSLESFIADIALFTSQDEDDGDDDYVTLMTIHSSKGLEFKSVFLVGMEENLFPNSLSLETRADLEEERRLFYVAVTRAQKRLTLSYASSRYRFGQIQFNEPSRFLDEVDASCIIKPTEAARRTVASPIPSARKPAARRNLKPMSRATASGAPSSFKAASPDEIKAGLSVVHPKFGKGKVLQIEGEGASKKATVNFDAKGQRILLLKYARLQIV